MTSSPPVREGTYEFHFNRFSAQKFQHSDSLLYCTSTYKGYKGHFVSSVREIIALYMLNYTKPKNTTYMQKPESLNIRTYCYVWLPLCFKGLKLVSVNKI
jgi:hypothetical protein